MLAEMRLRINYLGRLHAVGSLSAGGR
jgi:hypothetical protein